EINAKGGVMKGRRIEIVFRDDGATPSDAVRVAEELLTRENVSFLAGTFLSNVGLAVADFANQKKVLFLATEPLTDAITMGAGNTVAALENTKPEGIFNALFGADLAVFVREGNTRGLFEKRTVASLLTGEPEYIIPLGEETPEGWITTGYPWEQIADAKHKAFVDAYRA